MASQYVVKAGDTLSAIGAKFGVPYTQITGYKSGNPNLIYPGEVLNVGGAPTSAPAPAPTAAPTSTPTSTTPRQSSGGGEPPYAPNVVNQTVSYNGVTWKGNPGTGWTREGGGVSGAVAGLTSTQPTLNLPDLYKNLYSTSGISDIEKTYSDQEKAFIEAKGKVNDNPFLSEATRVGRVAKLESLFAERTANLKKDIATKKADIETQLNLQTKQFDINSQASQQAWSQLNTLLSMGALDGATGEDIAAITRSTGVSSDMLYSAIDASKKKNIKTSVIQSTNDAGVVTVSVINADTGEVIKQTSLGAIGNAEKAVAPKAQTSGEQKASVEVSISSYLGSKALQAQISPEDLYMKLIQTYPEAIDYIKENWTARDIRIANGEKL